MAGSITTLEQQDGSVPAIVCGDWLGSVLDSVVLGDNCDVLGQFPRESVDLVVTSPPYDDLRTYGGHSWDFYGVAWQLKRVLKPGGVIVWNVNDATDGGTESGTSFEQAMHFKRLGLNLHDTMIWSKGGFTAVGSTAVRYGPVFEYMFVLSNGKPKTFNPIRDRSNKTVGDKRHGTIRQADGTFKNVSNAGKLTEETGIRFNIWEIPNPGVAGNEHPATFPIQIAADHITTWSNPGDIVIDPFSGSGTTCRAAKDLNRRFVGIEINPAYLEIAKRRLAQDVLDLSA